MQREVTDAEAAAQAAMRRIADLETQLNETDKAEHDFLQLQVWFIKINNKQVRANNVYGRSFCVE